MKLHEKFSVKVILVQDEVDKGFTAFFAQWPNIIAQGNDEQEATHNLVVLVKDVFSHQENQELSQVQNVGMHVHTKSFDLELAY